MTRRRILIAGGGTLVAFAVVLAASVALRAPRAGANPVPDGVDRPNPFLTGHTLVIPHAGGDGMFPEDTLYAYEHSMALGGEVIDLDVQGTADGQLVAIHDATVDRTTNGTGTVAQMTVAELQRLDAGWSFTVAGGQPFRGKGLRIPTIREVLERFPDRLATLDLKDQRVEVVGVICDLVRDLGRQDTVYVGVDTTEQVMEFRRRCPWLRTSGTSEERQAARAARDRGDLTYRSPQTVSQPSYLAEDGTPRVTPDSVAAAHARNVAVFPWVVDDPATLQALVDMGVDGIYTRRPDLLVPIVQAVG